ncbi:MAG TPA: hypothetical protein VIB78_01825 [Acidimicrobiia bacterium]|jgi:hypothetical protein
MKTKSEERGASAILIAFGLVLFLGMSAFAIDLGFGLTERRDDVTAADVGVMAGAVDSLGSNAVVRDQILSFTRQNLPTTYSNAQWQALWEGCTDPEMITLNGAGFNFIPVAPPAGWAVGSPWCISIDPAGYVRVRVPDQNVATNFGRVIGVNSLSTNADAIARWAGRGGGGILPFGLLSGAPEGGNVCLRDHGGQPIPPCDGPDQGNFGAIESPQFGNVALGTTGCPMFGNKGAELSVNIAIGLDHRVVPDPDNSPSNEVRDTCAIISSGQTPDTLNTFQGLSVGTMEGLVSGGNPFPGSFSPPRLQRSATTTNIVGYQLDNKPMWEYIDPAVAAPTVPAQCVRSTFNNSLPDFDWNGDGTLDRPQSWEHMESCLLAHAGGSFGILFLETLSESPRFSYVPQFWANIWPNGNSDFRRIWRFKATFLQTLWLKKGNNVSEFNPGEQFTSPGNGNVSLFQLSGLNIPDQALPEDLRGTPGPTGGLNPFIPELYR